MRFVRQIMPLETVEQLNQDLALDPIETPDSMNTAEAAQMLGKSERTVQRLLQQGALSGYKVRGPKGDQWRVHRPVVMLEPRGARLDELEMRIFKAECSLHELTLELIEIATKCNSFDIRTAQLEAQLVVEQEQTLQDLQTIQGIAGSKADRSTGWWNKMMVRLTKLNS